MPDMEHLAAASLGPTPPAVNATGRLSLSTLVPLSRGHPRPLAAKRRRRRPVVGPHARDSSDLLGGCTSVPVGDLPGPVLAPVDLGCTKGVGPRGAIDGRGGVLEAHRVGGVSEHFGF